ncbi:hypothetical protein ACWDUI_25845, partial [Streptosporangium sandarakinum]
MPALPADHSGGAALPAWTTLRSLLSAGDARCATPRTFLYGALTALTPVGDGSRRIVPARTARYTLTLAQSEPASRQER